MNASDVEKGRHGPSSSQLPEEKQLGTVVDVGSGDGFSNESSVRYNSLPVTQDRGILSRLRDFESFMDRKLGVESEAIDRKRPEDKRHVKWHEELTMALLWASGTMNVSCFATGFLGWEIFGLNLCQSILICIFASLLGGAATGFCATFGAPTGLRQISVGRYSFGWYPNKLIALLNTIQQIGWSAVGCITGGLALEAVADGGIDIAAGVIIIAVVSLLVSFVGLKAILVYERYAWFIYLVIFIIIFGMTGEYASNKPNPELTNPPLSTATVAGNALSLIAIVYGSSASWATIASDYYVVYPENVSRFKVWIMTTLGVALPTSIGMVAGCVVSSAFNNRPDWSDAYNEGLGYVIQVMLHPRGFAKFILVLLVLSGINCNILNTYSAAISLQQLARPFARIPRFLWTILCFAITLLLAIIGRNHLNEYLQNFLALLGYWCTSYFVILFIEHYYFRKGNFANYDLEGWNDPHVLPHGIGAATAFLLGVVAWVMGMVETWYVGPLGALIGEWGGDVANEFTFVVTIVAYIPARHLELKYFNR
ncbi:purine-cytosine permease FCY21 [Polychaeton citri CBS 116435]|uniref:Purine-cytosine permease FCY21 n=1 Tax=Polychaeton citri CBS 116435 TaxID=1314669 RepID=A0A9P4Q1C0_9PEZI|nr:purine-cytosine permease FCY21 [Polychaeton citri CBS 116435]